MNKKNILHLYIYGDQHHSTSKNLKRGERVISDGGSNIHTNFLLRIKDEFKITIYTYQDNYQVKNFFGNFSNIKIKEFPTLSGLFKSYLLKIEIFTRCFYPGLTFLFKKINQQYVITQTDFLPDTFSAFCLKIRNPKAVWIASSFLTAPLPWSKNSPYKGRRWIIGFIYWMLQKPSIWMIKSRADKVLVTSAPDIKQFLSKKRDESKVIAIQGGVDIDESEKYLNSKKIIPVKKRKYDACFVGRFHYQKGVLELIDIWKIICDQKESAKLAIIGAGPLEKELRKKIKDCGLESNIDLLGFASGNDKYEIFKQSKVIVHPATYDSGGMAAAEGMAWGLPGISFDLEALKTYYPKGMIKTEIGNHRQFADNILKLLNNKKNYKKTAFKALELIREVWDWDKRAEYTANKLFK